MNKKVVTLFLLFTTFISYSQTQYMSSFDGVKIAYTDEGKGEVVLLIHGFINSGNSWNKTVLKEELLQKGYRVITPDLRGTGLSDKPQEDKGYSDGAEVKDLVQLINTINISKYTAIGYSRGSIILAQLLTQDKRIKKAVLGGIGLDFTIENWDRRLMFAQAFDGNIVPETEGAVNYAKSINADLRSLHLQQKYQACPSVEELSKIKAKILVIAGDLDTDNGNPLELQQVIPRSEIAIVKGGHNETAKTEGFSKAIMQFL